MSRNNISSSKEILSVSWSPSGNNILYSEKGELLPKILNVKTNYVWTISNKDIQYSSDIKFVLFLTNDSFCTYSFDGWLHLWFSNKDTGIYESFYYIQYDEITSIAWNSKRELLALSYLNNVDILDLSATQIKNYTCISLEEHLKIASIAWSPDGRHIALCNKKIEESSEDKLGYLVSIWNTERHFGICVAYVDKLYDKECTEHRYVTGHSQFGRARRHTSESCTKTYYSSNFISWSPDGNYITYNNNYYNSLRILKIINQNNNSKRVYMHIELPAIIYTPSQENITDFSKKLELIFNIIILKEKLEKSGFNRNTLTGATKLSETQTNIIEQLNKLNLNNINSNIKIKLNEFKKNLEIKLEVKLKNNSKKYNTFSEYYEYRRNIYEYLDNIIKPFIVDILKNIPTLSENDFNILLDKLDKYQEQNIYYLIRIQISYDSSLHYNLGILYIRILDKFIIALQNKEKNPNNINLINESKKLLNNLLIAKEDNFNNKFTKYYSLENDDILRDNLKITKLQNISSIIWDSNSENIIYSSKEGDLKTYNINTYNVKLYKTKNQPINQIQISSDGKYLAVASNNVDILDYIVIKNSTENYYELGIKQAKINSYQAVQHGVIPIFFSYLKYSIGMGDNLRAKSKEKKTSRTKIAKNLDNLKTLKEKVLDKYNSFKINLTQQKKNNKKNGRGSNATTLPNENSE
jgi:hypothetical protein